MYEEFRIREGRVIGRSKRQGRGGEMSAVARTCPAFRK